MRGWDYPHPLFFIMAFDFDIMANNLAGMRDMNPIKITYKGVEYSAFRDVLSSEMQMSLYGAHNAIEITVGVLRKELKAEIKQGEPVKVFAPHFGYKAKELWIVGIREDAGGLSIRMDLEVRYSDG